MNMEKPRENWSEMTEPMTREVAEALTDQIRENMRVYDNDADALEAQGYAQPSAPEHMALMVKTAQLYDPDMFTDEELESVQRFTFEQASALDTVLVERVKDTAFGLEFIAGLVSYAKAGLIHEVLEYPSWPAYIRERLQPLCVSYDDGSRREFAIKLHEHGMSIRDAATATGQSKSAVGRAVSQSGTPDSAMTETTDAKGRTQTRHRNKAQKTPEAKFYTALEKLTNNAERLVKSLGAVVQGVEAIPKTEDLTSYADDLKATRYVLEKQCDLISQIIERLELVATPAGTV